MAHLIMSPYTYRFSPLGCAEKVYKRFPIILLDVWRWIPFYSGLESSSLGESTVYMSQIDFIERHATNLIKLGLVMPNTNRPGLVDGQSPLHWLKVPQEMDDNRPVCEQLRITAKAEVDLLTYLRLCIFIILTKVKNLTTVISKKS